MEHVGRRDRIRLRHAVRPAVPAAAHGYADGHPAGVRASFRGIPHRHGTGRGVRDSSVGVAAMVLVTMISGRPGADVQRMRLLGPLGFGDIAMLVMLVLFEWVIPWFRQGRTLGGSYTHMTCETTPRSGARRVAFYAARFAAIRRVVFCGRVPWAGVVNIRHGRVLAGPQTDAVRLDLTSLAASSVQLSGTMES